VCSIPSRARWVWVRTVHEWTANTLHIYTSIAVRPTSERESVCVWWLAHLYSSVHIINFWGSPKKRKKRKKTNKQRKGLILRFFLFSCCSGWCFVTSFVSRLTSLAQSRLGPARYHCWTIIQLAFLTNIVLVPLVFSPPTAPHIRLQLYKSCCYSTDTLLSMAADLLVAVPSCSAR